MYQASTQLVKHEESVWMLMLPKPASFSDTTNQGLLRLFSWLHVAPNNSNLGSSGCPMLAEDPFFTMQCGDPPNGLRPCARFLVEASGVGGSLEIHIQNHSKVNTGNRPQPSVATFMSPHSCLLHVLEQLHPISNGVKRFQALS